MEDQLICKDKQKGGDLPKPGSGNQDVEEDSWGDSSSESENARKKEVAQKWKEVYGNASKTPTPEPGPDEEDNTTIGIGIGKQKQSTNSNSTNLLSLDASVKKEGHIIKNSTHLDNAMDEEKNLLNSPNTADNTKNASFLEVNKKVENKITIEKLPLSKDNTPDIFDIKKPSDDPENPITDKVNAPIKKFTSSTLDKPTNEDESESSWSESEVESNKKLDNDQADPTFNTTVIKEDITNIDRVFKDFQADEAKIGAVTGSNLDWSSSSDDEDDGFQKVKDLNAIPVQAEIETLHEKEQLQTIREDQELEALSPASSWSCSLDDRHDYDLKKPSIQHKHEPEPDDIPVSVTIKSSDAATWASSSAKPTIKSKDIVVAKANVTATSNAEDNLEDWSEDEKDISEKGDTKLSSKPSEVAGEAAQHVNHNVNFELKDTHVATSQGDLEPGVPSIASTTSTMKKDTQQDLFSTDTDYSIDEEKMKKVEKLFSFKEPSSSTTEKSSVVKKSKKFKDKKPQAVVLAQPKHITPRLNRTSTDPIPYSTLLLSDPILLQKQMSLSANELNLNVENSNIMTTDLPTTSKSLHNLSTATTTITASSSAPNVRKPFFKRLKGKLSQITRSRSSSSKSSKSIPSLSMGSRDRSGSVDTVNSHDASYGKIVEELSEEPEKDADELGKSEEQFFRLLKEAKNILERIQSTRSMDDDALLLAEAAKSTSDIALDSSVTSGSGAKSSSHSQAPCAGMTGMGYCDKLDPCNPDPNIVHDVLNELACIYQKLFGSKCTTVSDCKQLEIWGQELQDKLSCCEQMKAELECEISCLQNALKLAEKALEEEIQRRMNLEGMVAGLRRQLDCLEEELCITKAQKQQLEGCLEDLQQRLHSCCETLQSLQLERDELVRSCAGHQEGFASENRKTLDLQAALAKCCAQYDDLVQKSGLMQAEINRLKREIDDLRAERDALLAKLKREEEEWMRDKRLADEIIAKLKAEVNCLKTSKDELCRKTNETVKLHHDELDCLSENAEHFKNMYETEKRAREDLQKRLQDCEEQKRKGLQQPVMQTQQVLQHQTQITQMQTDCTQFQMDIQRLEQERAALGSAKQCLEKQLEDVHDEKIALENELQGYRDQSKATESEKIAIDDIKQELQESLQVGEELKLKIQNDKDFYEEKIKLVDEERASLRKAKAHLEDELQSLTAEKAVLENEKIQLERTNQIAADYKLKQLEQRLRNAEEENAKLQEMIDLKRDVEEELIKNKNYAERELIHRDDLQKLKTEYEIQLENYKEKQKNETKRELKKQMEEARKSFELEFKEKIEKATVPDANGNTSIVPDPELLATNKSLKHDIKKLKKMVNERDEQIGALQVVINEVKKKCSEQSKQLRIQKIQMDGLRDDLQRQESQANSERDEFELENRRLLQERKSLEKEKSQLKEKILLVEKERTTLQHLVKAKERIEADILKLKEAITTQFVDRTEVEKIIGGYDKKLTGMKSQFEAQLEMNRQLAEINEYLGRQSQDRAMIEKIRDSNENLLRKELNSVSAAMRLDTEKLKKLIKERDEEIVSLRKAVGVLKTKYATEAQQREELTKKVQILSTISHESLHPSSSNYSQRNNNNNT